MVFRSAPTYENGCNHVSVRLRPIVLVRFGAVDENDSGAHPATNRLNTGPATKREVIKDKGENPKPGLVIQPLELSYTNDELVRLMRWCRDHRERNPNDHIVCTIGGFDDDPRELGQIPEARALCRRLVGIGFISWLDVCTSIPQLKGIGMEAGLGAFEVWAIAEGILGAAGGYDIPKETLAHFRKDLGKGKPDSRSYCLVVVMRSGSAFATGPGNNCRTMMNVAPWTTSSGV